MESRVAEHSRGFRRTPLKDGCSEWAARRKANQTDWWSYWGDGDLKQARCNIDSPRDAEASRYLLHGLEQRLSVVLESHDELQLGAARFHSCVGGRGEGRKKKNKALKCSIGI